MATSCESCDYKDNEVKSGGAIEDKGCHIELHIKEMVDLSRDVLKVRGRILFPNLVLMSKKRKQVKPFSYSNLLHISLEASYYFIVENDFTNWILPIRGIDF